MPLKTLIENFSVTNLKDVFREKIAAFKPYDENYEYLFDEQITDNYEDIKKIGEADLTNTDDILIITAKTLNQLTTRTGKKRQYEIAKKILKEEDKDAAFFIFYDDDGNFRFSLIRVNFIGAKRDFTDFKRYTYFVSPKQTNKTFINQISKCDFNSLDSIQEAFSVEPITKQFYEKLQRWYFWAIKNVEFPKDAEQETNGREVAIIRLITRLMFIWFMKVRMLIPDELFDEENISKMLKDFSREDSTYYKAVLQNLFFATLNTEQNERKFRSEDRGAKGYNQDFGNPNVFRYHKLFNNSEELEKLFSKIPFLNGGLFECLDYKTKDKNERKYIDGFTATKEQQPKVPNFLFFSEIVKVDISSFFGKENNKYEVEGLINLLNSYNFTIDENEPDDVEVALDPELLGSIFENLLASYNPETATTAKKATGSFYTPREIVNYMTNESLKQYFRTNLEISPNIDENLEFLINATTSENPFDDGTTKKIINLINNLRVVDPAVGSGAFPMAMLNKLVFILGKLDPDNKYWEQSQIEGVKKSVSDSVVQRKLIEQIERQFKEKNADYGRKLYLIEKCIYGVDIQQIAVEIAKLRFFISLLVDEKIDFNRPENNYGIEPLPNLDFKLMQGNSLISTYAGIDFNDKKEVQTEDIFNGENDTYKELIIKFEDLKHQYQNEADNLVKKELRGKIDKSVIKLFEEKISERFPELKAIEDKAKLFPKEEQRQKYITEEKQKLTKKLGFDIEQIEKDLTAYTEGRKPKDFFLWNVYFAEVFNEKARTERSRSGGFDIVIGNPPYIGQKGHKEIFQTIKSSPLGKKFHQRRMDMFYFFFHLGLMDLKLNGILCFITTNYYLTATYSDKLRKHIYEDATVLSLINFNELKLFESATGQHNLITILRKGKNNKILAVTSITKRKNTANNSLIKEILSRNDIETNYYEQTQDMIFEEGTLYMRIEPNDYELSSNSTHSIQSLLNKMKQNCNKLSKYCFIEQGIVSGADKVSDSMIRKYPESKFTKGEGIYILTNEEIKEKLFSKEDEAYLKKVYKNSDIDKWTFKPDNSLNVLYIKSTGEYIEPSHNIKKHLDKFKPILINRNVRVGSITEKDYQDFVDGKIEISYIMNATSMKSGNYYCLSYARRSRDTFEVPKIVNSRRANSNIFALEENSYYEQSDIVITTIKPEHKDKISLHYILGVLNSNLLYSWFYYKGKRKGEMLELFQKPISEVPLRIDKVYIQNLISNKVEEIITIKSRIQSANVSNIEKEIDMLVYKLYELTYEEVKIVEPAFALTKMEYDNFAI